MTSNRWRDTQLPTQPAPRCARPYQLYGQSATDAEAQAKHQTWVAELRSFQRRLLSGEAVQDLGVISYKAKLTEQRLSQHFSCGSFTKLLMLSDFADSFGPGFVQMPCTFGPGVHIGEFHLDGEDLKDWAKDLDRSGQFRQAFGRHVRAYHLGHLICEVRQGCFRFLDNDAVLRILGDVHAAGREEGRASRQFVYEKRTLCDVLAAYASRTG